MSLKIQFRQIRGWSLKTELVATRAFQDAAEVPLSESLVYDGGGEPLPFESLLIPREPGKSGISCYLDASRVQRLELGSLLGEKVAHVHGRPCPRELQSRNERDLTSWEETIREALFGDKVLASSLAETGVHDRLQAGGEYVHKPDSEHFEPGYLDAFQSSYERVLGRPRAGVSAVEEKVLAIVSNLRQVMFFRDCGLLLHPKTPRHMAAAVSDLESLQQDG